MSAMVDNAIDELEEHKKEITSLLLIADTEDMQIFKLGANGATTQQLMALVGSLEMAKQNILDAVRDGIDGDEDDGVSLQ